MRSTSDGQPILYKPRYRSRLEERIAGQLQARDISFTYEQVKLKYTIPARVATYTPDFNIDGMMIEAKGYFRTTADRQKLLLVKEQHPDRDIRLLFQKASNPIYKGSKTTYGQWASDHGFTWADGGKIPEAWIEEALSERKATEALQDEGFDQST